MATVNGRGRPPKQETLDLIESLKGMKRAESRTVKGPYRRVKHVVDYYFVDAGVGEFEVYGTESPEEWEVYRV